MSIRIEPSHDGHTVIIDGQRLDTFPTAGAAAKAIAEHLDTDTPADPVWIVSPLLVPEGIPTSDGRLIEPGALTWRTPPLPLMLQTITADGHDGAELAGTIVELYRVDGGIAADIRLHPSDAGQRLHDILQADGRFGVSVDLGDVDADIVVTAVDEDGDPIEGMHITRAARIMGATACPFPAFEGAHLALQPQPADVEVDTTIPNDMPIAADTPAPAADGAPTSTEFTADDALVAAATGHTGVVIMAGIDPADADRLALGTDTAEPADALHITLGYLGNIDDDTWADEQRRTGLLESMRDHADTTHPYNVDAFAVAAFNGHTDERETAHVLLVQGADLAHARTVVETLIEDAETFPVWMPHLTLQYGDTPDPDALTDRLGELRIDRIVVAFGDEHHTLPYSTEDPAAVDEDDPALTAALVASAATMRADGPPPEWFTNPNLDGPTPITVTPDGRIYGHAATWGTCHIGLPGCVTPPRSPSGYAYFRRGEVGCGPCGEATIPTGTITMGTGHAAMTADANDTSAHYDNTGLQAADVNIGEDAHGIWVSGAVRPHILEDEQAFRTLRASPLSGDWRSIRGKLELVGLLAVNVPGFPVPRTATDYALAASASPSPVMPTARRHDDVTVALVAAGRLTLSAQAMETPQAMEHGPSHDDVTAMRRTVYATEIARLRRAVADGIRDRIG